MKGPFAPTFVNPEDDPNRAKKKRVRDAPGAAAPASSIRHRARSTCLLTAGCAAAPGRITNRFSGPASPVAERWRSVP